MYALTGGMFTYVARDYVYARDMLLLRLDSQHNKNINEVN